MISLTHNSLQLPAGCYQAACRFDSSAYSDGQFEELGVALPARLSGAVPKRKAEFLAGRYCVQLALEAMGEASTPDIAIGERRAPQWPAGIVGSITHSHGFAAAALARTRVRRGIGIDSEQLIKEKTANNVASHILVDSETYTANRSLVASPRHYLTLIFSAKESLFKCLYPQVNCYFDFRDAEVFLNPDEPGSFSFRLRKALTEEFCEGYSNSGRYALDGDFIHTAVVL